jgi:hypothetical protein
VGLAVSGLTHADALATIGLVAGVGILLGLGWETWQRLVRLS